MKRFLLPVISIFFLMAAVFSSCEVGLGESVDTMPPAVSIELPSAGYIIRDSFEMSGTCSDESGLASVEISLKNTSTKKTYPSYFAEIDSIKNVWTCKIDPLVAGKSVPDGTYEATVTATDKAGRKTSATKSFVLDNTAPILVLTRPSTKISIDENQTYDTYGAEFDITGQAADDNNIEKLVVSIYEDAARTKHIKDVELKNVPPTIDLAVAKWGEKEGELAGIYESIYGNEKAGTKAFYCTITIYDEARHCPPIENDTGNSRNAYYLYKDIYTDLLKKYKTTQIYHMLNGSYESTDVGSRDATSDIDAEIQKVKTILESSKTEIGSFSLNPENSPTYSLSGFETLYGKTENENYNLIFNNTNDYGILSSSSMTVKFSAGLDKSPLVEKSLGFYFIPYIQNDDGSWSVSRKDSDRIWVIKPYERDSEGNWKDTIDVSEFPEEKQSKALAYFKDVRKYIATVGSYDFTATMNISTTEFLPIATGKIYALGATGCDENLNSFINLNSYGFMFLSSGAAPTLEIEKINGMAAKSSWYVKKDSGMTISGKISAEEKSSVRITVQDKNNNKVEIPESIIPVFTSSDSPQEEAWELTVPNEYFTKTIDENGNTISSNYTVTVSAICGSRITEKQIAVGYDVDGPVVEISSVLPYASISSEENSKKYTVNGTFAVKVTVADEFYKLSETEKTTLAIFSDYGTENSKELYIYSTSDSNISHEINSREKLNDIDKKDLEIVVTSYDYAGNKTVETQSIYLDQDTDKPIVKLTNAILKDDDSAEDYTNSYPSGGKKNLFLSSAPVNATISDDDGIESIEVNIYDENNNKIEENSKLIEKKDITSNPYPLSFEVPSDIGTYSVEIIVKDTESELENEKCKFYFMVDTGKPSIVVNKSSDGEYFGKKGGKIHVTGTYSGLAGLKIYRKDGKSITGTINENSQNGTWEDDFPVDSSAEESANPFESSYVIEDTKERKTEVSFKYYVDNTLPEVTINKINDKNLVEDKMFRFSGTTKDVAGSGRIASGLNSRWYLLKKNTETIPKPDSEKNAQENGWKELSGVSEEWNFTQEFNEGGAEDFCEGEYVLYVIAFDIAKNISEMASYSFSVDLNAPRIETSYSSGESDGSSVIADSNAIAITKKPYTFKYTIKDTFGLASENPVSVNIYKNDSNGNPLKLEDSNYKNDYKDDNGSIAIFEKSGETENPQLDGTYIYEITAKDAKGKTSTVNRTIVLDTTSPSIEIISPDENGWITTSSNKIVVNGTATDENGVKAVFYSTSSKENIPTLDEDGSFKFSESWKKLAGATSWKISDFNLNPGEDNKLYLIAFDIYGNKSEIIEKQFKYDGEAPKIESVKITKFVKDSESGEKVTLDNNYSGYLNGSINKIKLEIITSDNYKLNKVQISAAKDSGTSENWSSKENIGISTDSTSLEYFIGSENSSEEKYLEDGTYKISVVATDFSGQSVTNQYEITIDTEKPAVGAPSLSAEPNTSNNGYNSSASPTLTITPSDSGSGILGVYYMVSSSKLEGDISASTIDSPLTKNSSGAGYSRKLSLQEGTNYINVKVEDNAGNVNYYTTDALTWNVDKTGPIVAFESPDVSAMLSNKVPQTYKIKVSDELSGIIEDSAATVSLVSKSNEDAAIAAQKPVVQKDSENNYYITGTFSADDMGKIQKGDSAELSVELTDAVGNKSAGKLTLTFDNTPPTVKIVNPAATVVNGTMSIFGTAKDNSGLSKVTVYRTKLLSGDTEDYTVDSGNYSGSYTKIKEFVGAEAYNWEIPEFDTKDFADNSSIIFYVIAEDTAGNTENAVKQVTIDQDSDRPEIKFTNLNIKNMASANFKMHKQETLYGTVTDDDGVSALYISEDDGKTWSDNLYDGGAWTYEFQKDDNGSIDSKHTLKFKVIDAENAEFVSSIGSGNMLKSPKLVDSATNKLGYKDNGSYSSSADTNLYLQIDTKDPSVGSTYYILTEERKSFTDEEVKNYTTSSDWKLETGLSAVGGKKKYLYWLIDSSDSSGIASVTASLAGMSAGEPIKTVIVEKTDSPESKICVFEFDVSSGYANGSANLIAVAKDNADRSSQAKLSVQIDNKPPVIEVSSHKNGAGVYGSESLNLRGISDDCEKLYLKVTDSSDVPETNFGNDSAEKTQWEEIDEYTSTGSWSIIFKTGNNIVGNIDYYAHEGTLNGYYDKLFVPTSSETTAETKEMYIWLYGEDSLGNISVPSGIYLKVNPQGDQPIVLVSYPETDASVGGTIRITGSAAVGTSSVTVDSVWIQIDPSYDGTFNENWEDELGTLLDSVDLSKESYGITATGVDTVGNAIVANGSTASWNLTINSNREFNEKGTNRKMAIRVWAYSSSKKLSESVVVPFELDPNSPVIGGTKELYLVQYKNNQNWGEIERQQKFENNMWIRGIWYLIGSVEDDSGIKELNWTSGGKSVNIINDSDKIKVADDIQSSSSYKNYYFSIPVGKSGDSVGSLEYRLYAKEGSVDNKDVENEFKFYYDNKAPELKATDAGYRNELSKTGLKIVQNNGTYTINGTVEEKTDTSSGANQSGFSRVILFFTRSLNNESYVVDPMLSSGNSGMENALKLSELAEKGGIYWQERTFVYNSDSGKIELNELPGNFIRAGGLCRIDDIDYVIKSVDYNAKTVTLKTVPSVNASTTTAYFAVAQVIDNTSIENGTTNAFNFNLSDDPTTNGDGDQMVEGVSQSGTTWKWSASINSSLILDGSIEINLVAFDEAGNSSEVKTYSGTVSNNAPRIAGVMFGSDDNNDGTVSDDEMVKSYSMIYTALNNGGIRNGYITANQIADNVTIPLSKNDSGTYNDVINIKGNFCVRPEIVGGNHGVGYNYNVTRGNSTIYAVDDIVRLSNVHSTGDVVRSAESNLNDIIISLKDMISNGLTDGANTVFNITLWDYTDGAIPGTDSNSANLHIYTNVDIYDEESPVITINPFYWNSVTDNSIYYMDGIAQGHVELESDLPTGTFTATKTGIYDRDPKVSGKIKIEGTASDNAMIKELRMTIPGLFTDKVVGEYSYSATNGWSWKSNGDLETDGFAAEIKNTSFGNNGHEIKWTVFVDTAKIKNVAVADVSVTATAVDRGKINANLEYVQRTENGKQSAVTSSSYKMDVVPYITGLDTILTDLEVSNPSVYGRTALGKYPVYYYRQTTSGSVNAETIIVNGFNLSGGTVTFASDTTSTGTLAADGSVAIPANAKSGKISVSVNGIESLNNKNNNDADGGYNRQPNNQNNNLLTDDVEIAIWEINSKAAIAESGELSEVVMHVNPANGMLGFAFAHSQDLASYPNGTKSSYQTWITDWTGVNQIGFTYDSKGTMFGTNGGTDTYTPNKKVGRFGLISSKWGTISEQSASNDKFSGYTRYRRLRLEYLGLARNGTYASNVYRFAKGDCSQFATVVPSDNTNLTNLYMIYYDNTLGELKFKAGQYDTSWSYGSNGSKVNLENSGFTKASFSFGDFADDAYNESCVSNLNAYNPNYATTSIVSTVASGANGNSNAKPGTYYSIAAVPSSDGNSDVVVAVWYDAINKNLWYSYITNPLTNAGKRNSTGAVSTEWAAPVAILKGTAGESCAIAVDEDGHVHIAAYSRKNAGSLYYAYLDSYSASFNEAKNLVKVDSYGSTGQYITMEVAKDSSGNNIPYIGYWMNSMSYPKYAYLVDTNISNGPKPGVDENNRYTGAWESIMLPTSSEVLRDDINIGLYKYQSAQNGHLKGEIREIPKLYSTSGTGTEYAGEKNGIAGGNGTANPVLAYGISETGSGYIETAQLK